MKTIQLRRYVILDGEYEPFIAWWQRTMPALRPAAGFTIEFAYGIPEKNEFIWAVSAPVGAEEFAKLDAIWASSDARAGAFAGEPHRFAEVHVSVVTEYATTA